MLGKSLCACEQMTGRGSGCMQRGHKKQSSSAECHHRSAPCCRVCSANHYQATVVTMPCCFKKHMFVLALVAKQVTTAISHAKYSITQQLGESRFSAKRCITAAHAHVFAVCCTQRRLRVTPSQLTVCHPDHVALYDAAACGHSKMRLLPACSTCTKERACLLLLLGHRVFHAAGLHASCPAHDLVYVSAQQLWLFQLDAT